MIYPRMPEEDRLDKFTRREVRRAATQLMWSRLDAWLAFGAMMIGYAGLFLAVMKFLPQHWSLLYGFVIGQPLLILSTNHIFKGWYR